MSKKAVPVKGTSPKVPKEAKGGFKGGHGAKHKAAPYGCDKKHKKKAQ
jgi:hypothetical protein